VIQFFKSLYIHNRFFTYISVFSALFLVSFWYPFLYSFTWMLVWLFLLIMLVDLLILYRFKNGFSAKRIVSDKLSNSDENEVAIILENKYPFQAFISLIDELPIQFQKRNFEHKISLNPAEKLTFTYSVRPVERGAYKFGTIHVFTSSLLQIFSRRYTFFDEREVKVYPSYVQMKKDYFGNLQELFGFTEP